MQKSAGQVAGTRIALCGTVKGIKAAALRSHKATDRLPDDPSCVPRVTDRCLSQSLLRVCLAHRVLCAQNCMHCRVDPPVGDGEALLHCWEGNATAAGQLHAAASWYIQADLQSAKQTLREDRASAY